MNTEEFINKAKEVHGDKYDYSKVEYINCKTKVCIICPIHGEFWQSPEKHINRCQGCGKCADEQNSEKNKYKFEDFLKLAYEKFGDKFKYNDKNYINFHTECQIICPTHGKIDVVPYNHIHSKYGCRKCAYEAISNSKCDTKQTFIEKSIKKYGNKFTYEKVDYKNSYNEVIITCSKHGDFKVKPNDFLQGQNCPNCTNEKYINKKRIKFEDFLKRARNVHGDKYQYDENDYIDMTHKVGFTCPFHGKQWQLASLHVRKIKPQGCPICKESHLERSINELLLNNNIEFERQKRFSWLGKQSLDFYLPKYNIAIECQGRQHFEIVNGFGGVKCYEKTILRDSVKKRLLEEHNIPILYYTDLDSYDSFFGEPLIKTEYELLTKINEFSS